MNFLTNMYSIEWRSDLKLVLELGVCENKCHKLTLWVFHHFLIQSVKSKFSLSIVHRVRKITEPCTQLNVHSVIRAMKRKSTHSLNNRLWVENSKIECLLRKLLCCQLFQHYQLSKKTKTSIIVLSTYCTSDPREMFKASNWLTKLDQKYNSPVG